LEVSIVPVKWWGCHVRAAATGFTGQLVSKYLAAKAPAGIKLALAGRSEDKLLKLRESLRSELDGSVGRKVEDMGILVADALNEAEVTKVAGSTRMVIAAAGPFAKYGTPLARAAARLGTDYADVTGEAAWVRSVIDSCDSQARSNGAILVPMSGFDSVPSDLGTYHAVNQVRRITGSGTSQVTAFVRVRGGGVSGGTLATMVNMLSSAELLKTGDDPLCMVPPDLGRAADAAVGGSPAARPGTAAIAPVADRWWFDWRPEVNAYAAPFAMEPVNSRCVRRSAALFAAGGTPYSSSGSSFGYSECTATSSGTKAFTTAFGGCLLRLATKIPFVAPLLGSFLPPPGTGPSEEAMKKASFEFKFVSTPSDMATDASASGAGLTALPTAPVVTTLRSVTDGYMATAVFISEIALAMVQQRADLPGAATGGVLTPATALGDVLIKRLEATKLFSFTVEGSEVTD
jgi:short subunit dehydrogenase-like uncharacterized protein